LESVRFKFAAGFTLQVLVGRARRIDRIHNFARAFRLSSDSLSLSLLQNLAHARVKLLVEHFTLTSMPVTLKSKRTSAMQSHYDKAFGLYGA
jgi:hypothetical protein